MMAAVAQARHDVLAPYLKPGITCDRLDQLADAVHDEGDLRAVPAAARRPGDRARRATCSRASTRISRSTIVDFPALDARLRAERRAGEADGAVGGAHHGTRRFGLIQQRRRQPFSSTGSRARSASSPAAIASLRSCARSPSSTPS